jgi:hypothetical protein
MLQYVIRGSWGLVIRRVLEAGTGGFLLMAVLFIPLVFGLGHIYHWVHPEQIANEEARTIVLAKSGYLKPWFFIVRAIGYFAIWILLSTILRGYSSKQDKTADRRYAGKSTELSGIGIVVLVFTITFASVDWVMSLDPEWFSTIFGLIFVIGWVLSAFTLVIAVMVALKDREPFRSLLGKTYFHDWGKLLLAFVMVWAYFSFSQFLIIWAGNLPEETRWYLHRLQGGWQYLALALVLLQFVFPFMLLLSRDIKRNTRTFLVIALLVFVMRFVDLYWMVVPNFNHAGHGPNILATVANIAAWIGFGGLWLFVFSMFLKKRPLIPFNDPHLPAAIAWGQKGGH